jgi:hypothetical protein
MRPLLASEGCSDARATAQEKPRIRRHAKVVVHQAARRVRAALRQQAREFGGRQRFGYDNERTHRRHAPSIPAERAVTRRSGRDQHLLCAHLAARRHDAIRAAFSFDRRHSCVLEEPHAVPCRRVREPHRKLAHVHLAAMLVQQTAEETIRLNFAANPLAADHFNIGIDFAPDQLGGLFEVFEMMRLRSEFQLARSKIVAIDRFFPDQSLDGLDGRCIRLIAAARTLRAKLCVERHIVLRNARVALPAVASGGAAAEPSRIKHGDHRAAPAQCERRGQAGEAAADHGDVNITVDWALAPRGAGGRGVEPVGIELHPVSSGDGDNVNYRPSSVATPPISSTS